MHELVFLVFCRLGLLGLLLCLNCMIFLLKLLFLNSSKFDKFGIRNSELTTDNSLKY